MEFLAEVFVEGVEEGGGGVWGVTVVAVAESGDGLLAEDFVDVFDVDEHAGVGVDRAGESGGEEEEGGDVEEGRFGGEGVGGLGRGGLEGFVEAEADFTCEGDAGDLVHGGIVAVGAKTKEPERARALLEHFHASVRRVLFLLGSLGLLDFLLTRVIAFCHITLLCVGREEIVVARRQVVTSSVSGNIVTQKRTLSRKIFNILW